MKTTVKMRDKGIRQVLTHPLIEAEINARGDRMAAAAGPGFQATRRHRIRRYGVTIRPRTDEARREQADNNRLMRGLEAGR